MEIKKIAILGGGTAGWLTANHLGVQFNLNPEVEVTLIESPNIPIIGVGEGTVPQIRNTLIRFGIPEHEFVNACDVSFKQGIKFVNWLDTTKHNKNYYYHPFDTPFVDKNNPAHSWIKQGFNESFASYVGIQEFLCEKKLCPKLVSSLPYEGVASYAYHLNAGKFAQLLQKNAINKFKIQHKYATILSAKRNDDGSIYSILSDQEEELIYDFYIDCSGFHSVLFEKVLNVSLIDKSKELLTNTALTLQVPVKETDEIPSCTLATAHKAGWIWDIALPHRRGVGFVYSDNHMDENEAISEFSNYLGIEIEKVSPRKINMKIGYREFFWHKNCVAIGLSQGFVEPLEATSILITDFSAEYLAKSFPKHTSDITVFSERYNKLLTYAWERIVDFIKLHYYISDRRDSAFWVDNTQSQGVSDELLNRLSIWKSKLPERLDFFSKFEVFDVENYLYVLYGMKYPTRVENMTLEYERKSQLNYQKNKNNQSKVCSSLIGHSEWLRRFKSAVVKAGFSSDDYV